MTEPTFETHNRLAALNTKYSCPHKDSELRRRTLSNNTVQCVHQCINCGAPIGNAIPQKRVNGKFGGVLNLPEFDDALLAQWNKNRQEEKSKILGSDHETTQNALSNFWQWYKEYLASPQWLEKRRKVLLRANGICEGCGNNKATEVHHLSYKHKGNEFLFELVALCSDCHGKIHKEHKVKNDHELSGL